MEEIKSLLMITIGLVIAFGFISIFHLILIDNKLDKILDNKKDTNQKKQVGQIHSKEAQGENH